MESKLIKNIKKINDLMMQTKGLIDIKTLGEYNTNLDYKICFNKFYIDTDIFYNEIIKNDFKFEFEVYNSENFKTLKFENINDFKNYYYNLKNNKYIYIYIVYKNIYTYINENRLYSFFDIIKEN